MQEVTSSTLVFSTTQKASKYSLQRHIEEISGEIIGRWSLFLFPKWSKNFAIFHIFVLRKRGKSMPTFKISVLKHQLRRDGKLPVSIRVTHNRESAYLKTDFYVLPKQVSPDYKSIHDANVVRQIDRDIIEYERIYYLVEKTAKVTP